MTSATQTTIIAIVFASQIVVLSFLTPRIRHRLQALMFRTFPQQEYPRLYPVPAARFERRQAVFKNMHTVIGIAVTAVLATELFRGSSPPDMARAMFYCMLVEILPLYLAMPWSIKVMRTARAMPPPHARSVELRQWHVLDFISPLSVGLGLAGPVLALTCAWIAYRYQPHSLPLIGLSLLFSLALLLRVLYVLLWHVPVVRVDPYMSAADTFRARQRRLRLLFRGAALMGLYLAFMLLYSARLLHFDFAYLLVGVSIVFQLLAVALVAAQKRDLRTRDFSVYRADGAAAGALISGE